MASLTPKQARFVEEYLIDLDATRAYMAAYTGAKKSTAKVQGCRYLQHTDIAAAIARGREARSKRVRATADDVVLELERLAMFDPGDLTEVKSPADIKKLPEDVRRAVIGWTWDRNGNFMIKMAKEGAIEMLARHHGVFEKDNKQLGASFAERLVKARERAGKA